MACQVIIDINYIEQKNVQICINGALTSYKG